MYKTKQKEDETIIFGCCHQAFDSVTFICTVLIFKESRASGDFIWGYIWGIHKYRVHKTIKGTIALIFLSSLFLEFLGSVLKGLVTMAIPSLA